VPFELIAFDGDDTLWHNERSFVDGRRQFHRLLEAAGVVLSDDEVEAHVTRTEVRNIRYYGYGVSSFTLSLIETAIDLTAGRIAASDLHTLIEQAKRMLTEEVELFPGVPETVGALSVSHPLMLITKGDLLHQTSKLERSGLRDHFRHVEVVSTKTPDVYGAILARHGVSAERFLMIGNSLRSDVLPVIEAGGWAVYVPSALSWSHEHAEPPPNGADRFFEMADLGAVRDLVRRLEGDGPVVRGTEGARVEGDGPVVRQTEGARVRRV
jgi:putative hydrolase of the HAD superfamily